VRARKRGSGRRRGVAAAVRERTGGREGEPRGGAGRGRTGGRESRGAGRGGPLAKRPAFMKISSGHTAARGTQQKIAIFFVVVMVAHPSQKGIRSQKKAINLGGADGLAAFVSPSKRNNAVVWYGFLRHQSRRERWGAQRAPAASARLPKGGAGSGTRALSQRSALHALPRCQRSVSGVRRGASRLPRGNRKEQ
jgi:hypothetical protein